jgi:hypothetical protein
METRETKQNIDSIKFATRGIRVSNLKILKEQKETNKLLGQLLKIEKDKEMRKRIKR